MNSRAKTTALYLGLAALYIAITFMTPVPVQTLHQYHVTELHFRILDMLVILPYLLIWGAAFYGYHRLTEYANLIKGNRDGRAMKQISRGLLFLTLWLPLSSVMSSLVKYVTIYHASLVTFSSQLNNYGTILLPFIGFLLIADGARDLSEIAKQRPSKFAVNCIALLLIIIGVSYTHLISTTHNPLTTTYHLSTDMVLATLAVPYIFMWLTGMLATYELYNYHRRVKGIIYSQSIALLAYGIGSLLITSMVIQYLTTLSSHLTILSINWILVIIYILLAIIAASFVLIAIGAKRLKKIEEV